MKKIALLLIAVLTIASCKDDVTFNNPGFEGLRNSNYLWKASSYNITINEMGYVTISGSDGGNPITLTFPSAAPERYVLGDVPSMVATYEQDGVLYSTENDGNANVVSVGDGEIVLDEINTNGSGAKTFTGSFKFNAYNAAGDKVINFSQGVFYELPLVGEIPLPVITCVDTEEASETARLAYEATFTDVTFVNPEAYEAACAAYKAALETQRLYCGDLEGIIQGKIDELGDCQFSCEQAVANRNTAQAQFESATMGNYITACNNYVTYLQQQITYCGDVDGTVQATIDALDCADDDGDTIPNVLEQDADSDGDGIVDSQDPDDDNDGIPTADEIMYDENGNPSDTDGDSAVNYLDVDDDNDGILTINESGDTDGDGVLNFLDNDDDDDSILTMFENPDPNGDNDLSDAQDTDGDGVADYLDDDDDGDGTITASENPDPNGDGNPSDALDTDGNGTPDYLQA